MPVPRVPEENPEDEAIIGEMRTDAELDQLYAAAHASRELDRLMPTVRQILTESGKLQDSNPSASVVWSVQALEFFLKMGVLRPALRYRLGFDTALSDKVFKDLIGRNGSAEAKKWLNR